MAAIDAAELEEMMMENENAEVKASDAVAAPVDGVVMPESMLTPLEFERVIEAIEYHYNMCDPDEHEINCGISEKINAIKHLIVCEA